MHHYRKTRNLYNTRQNQDGCPFCHPETIAKRVHDTPHNYIVSNLTHYDLWEMRNVTDHLLIVPKRHAESLGELSKEERADIMELVAKYESQGYNIYARSTDSVTRSVPHQHTHLIKTGHKKAKILLFLEKPYLLFKF